MYDNRDQNKNIEREFFPGDLWDHYSAVMGLAIAYLEGKPIDDADYRKTLEPILADIVRTKEKYGELYLAHKKYPRAETFLTVARDVYDKIHWGESIQVVFEQVDETKRLMNETIHLCLFG